jgi:hypothetical protein
LLGDATDALQDSGQALTRAEIYILLASCYLHDIGMQDMVVGEKCWDELVVDDYEIIRARHPKRGKEIIVEGALSPERGGLRVDLDDLPEYMQPIALVSQGHGSDFYEATIREFDDKVWAADGKSVRGSLLTSLLLMGDELDIGSERASFPQGGHLSSISALHHFLNHYVVLTAVRRGRTSKRRLVHMAFEFPPDSDEYRPDVRRVLVDKVCAQARRTNPTVERATDGELVWEDRVVVSEQTDTMKVRRQIDPGALRQLRRDLRLADLVGRNDVVHCIRAALSAPTGVAVISLVTPADSDLDAVSRWIAAETVAMDGRYLEIGFRPQVGREAAAVLRELADWAGCARAEGSSGSTASAAEVGEALAAEPGDVHVLVLRFIEDADQHALDVIREAMDAFKTSGGHGVVVLSHDGSTEHQADHNHVLQPVDRETLARHLSKEFGYVNDEAKALADDLLAGSEGCAGPIVSRLAVRRIGHQADG